MIGAEAIARSIVTHRLRWTIVAALVLVLALALGSRLALRHEAADFLPRGARSLPDFPAGSAERIIVALETTKPLPVPAAAPLLDSLAVRLRRAAGVRAVEHRLPEPLGRFLDSIAPRHGLALLDTVTLARLATRSSRDAIERAVRGIPDTGVSGRLVAATGLRARDPLGVLGPLGALARAASGDAPVRLAGGYFVAPNRLAWIVVVEPDSTPSGIAAARELVRGIDSVLALTRRDPAFSAVQPAPRLFAVGRPVAYVQAFDMAKGDIRRVTGAAALAVVVLLALFFRAPRAPLFVLGTVAFGIAVTGAVAWIAVGAVSLIAWLFIAILVGLGDEFAIYIVSHYWMASEPGASDESALTTAISRPGPAILLGGVTAMIAFLSLLFVSYPVVVQVGWLTAAGLLILIACSFTVLPLALSWTRPAHHPAAPWRWWIGAARRAAGAPPLPALLFWAIFVGASLWCARGIRLEPHPWRVAVRGHPATAELERVQRLLGTSFTPLVMTTEGSSREQALDREREAVRELYRLRHRAGIARIESLSRWLPSRAEQAASAAFVARRSDHFSPARLERDFRSALAAATAPDPRLESEYLPRVAQHFRVPEPLALTDLEEAGLEDMVARHVRPAGDRWRAVSYVYLRESPWAEGVVERFTRTVRGATAPLARAAFSGDALRGASSRSALRRDIATATAVGLTLVLVVLLARFRRPSRVLLCLIPLLAGISVTLGVMGLFDIDLTALTVTITPLLVGLGVDDGIHMVDGLDRGVPVDRVIAETAAPMTITTATTVAGFACMSFASFAGVRELGLVAALGLTTCLAASLHLVPVVYRVLVRATNERDTPDGGHGGAPQSRVGTAIG